MKEIGFVFAAGLGTRLKPLTNYKPKALVKLDGITLLDNAIEKFIQAGVYDIVINVHHFPDLIIEYVNSKKYTANIIISDERAYLRETAGGLKFAEPYWFNKDILIIYNVDIYSSINLRELIDYHIVNDNDATLAVRNRSTSRYLLFDDDNGKLCGWTNTKTSEVILSDNISNYKKFAFSGIHVLNTSFATKIYSVEKLSLTNFYLNSMNNSNIRCYVHNNDTWADVGKIDDFGNRLS